ncbi:MAG: UPF0164 family protein [Calditrichaeota bacterium]|nr:UPF0164 family protein [Calditrichota bacterium]
MLKKIAYIFPLLFSLVFNILGQTKVGTTAANFLTIPIGARATGMGGAFVALASDATSAYWNPAGLVRLNGNEINITHTPWLVGTDLNWLSIALKFGPNAIGVSFNQLDYGSEEITTAQNPMGTGQKWEAADMAFGLSYARSLTNRFSFGATVKYIKQQIWHESATAIAMDVGLLFRTDFRGLTIGMNISNFGHEIKMKGKDLLQPVDIDPGNSGNNANIVANMDTDSWPLPLAFTVGLGMDVLRNKGWRVTIAGDATHPNDQKLYLNFGSEVSWRETLTLRAGYNSLFKEMAQEGLTLGFGLRYPIGSMVVSVDYSYMDFGVFNEISRYSLNVQF